MTSLLRCVCLSSFVLLASCIGGQTGQEDRRPRSECEQPGTSPERTALTELGFSAADLEEQLSGELTALLTWWNGSSTELALDLLEVRAHTLRTSEPYGCVLELDVLIAVATTDGLLDEIVEAKVSSPHIGSWTLHGQVALDALRGEFRVSDLGIDLSRERPTSLSMRLMGPTLSGIVTLDPDDPEPNDDMQPVPHLIGGVQGL